MEVVRLPLFGGEIGRVEEKEEKTGERGVWLERGGGGNFGGPGCLAGKGRGRKLGGFCFNSINYIFVPLFVTLNMKISGNVGI